MLYAIYGEDISKGRGKAQSLIDSLLTKKPDAAFIRVDGDSWNPATIESHLGGQGLFSNKYIVYLDRVSENADAKEALLEFLEPMQKSQNIFILLEGKVSAEAKRSLEKHAEKTVECASGEKFPWKKNEVNAFALGDAMGMRDRVKAWMLYRQAIDSGIEPENIAGTLFWQAKSMCLSANALSAAASGLNPYVFGKSKRFAANYSSDELGGLARKLVVAYHDSHRGLNDLELSLERLLLAL